MPTQEHFISRANSSSGPQNNNVGATNLPCGPARPTVCSNVENSQSPKPLRVGVAGVGHIGSNHARLYAELSSIDFCAVYDIDTHLANAIARKYGVTPAGSLEEFASMIDAASIATPTNAHYPVSHAL